jgi:hypothetical protein
VVNRLVFERERLDGLGAGWKEFQPADRQEDER